LKHQFNSDELTIDVEHWNPVRISMFASSCYG